MRKAPKQYAQLNQEWCFWCYQLHIEAGPAQFSDRGQYLETFVFLRSLDLVELVQQLAAQGFVEYGFLFAQLHLQLNFSAWWRSSSRTWVLIRRRMKGWIIRFSRWRALRS